MKDIITNNNKVINGLFINHKLERCKNNIVEIMLALYAGKQDMVILDMRALYNNLLFLQDMIMENDKEQENKTN